MLPKHSAASVAVTSHYVAHARTHMHAPCTRLPVYRLHGRRVLQRARHAARAGRNADVYGQSIVWKAGAAAERQAPGLVGEAAGAHGGRVHHGPGFGSMARPSRGVSTATRRCSLLRGMRFAAGM